jgi:cold shock CspA family protein
MSDRSTGKVKFFSDVRGYGFIVPDGGGDEVFLHRTDLPNGVQLVATDQRVSYVMLDSRGKGNGKKAAKVELL